LNSHILSQNRGASEGPRWLWGQAARFRRWQLVSLLILLLAQPLWAELLASPIRFEKTTDGVRESLVLRNTSSVPVTLRLNAELLNTTSSHSLPRLYVIPALGTVQGPTFEPDDSRSAWRYQTDYLFQFGDYRLAGCETPFFLPWNPGESYQCIQGFHGSFSHHGGEAYAADFDLQEGTPVLAARDGLVVSIVEHFTEAGTTQDFFDKANVVMVAHDDGSLSRYLHIQPGSAKVTLGQRVQRGEILALSGNTGMSAGPHLHFEVAKPGSNLVTTTMPFLLLYEGMAEQPQVGKTYKAPVE